MARPHPQRIERLLATLPAHGLQAVVLLPGPNLHYFSGLSFHLMGRPTLLILTAESPPALVVPALERAKAEANRIGAQVFSYGEDPAERLPAVREACAAAGLGRLTTGVEPLRMRWMEERLLEEAMPGLRLASAEEAIDQIRSIKHAEEIAAIRRAVEVAQAALIETLPTIRLGASELELASELTLRLLRAGSETELPFQPIVASGPNSALPHAVATDRRLQPGDLLIVDWGATVDGYISDLTRTFALGEVDPEFVRIHAAVERANAAGRAAAGPGVVCGDVDRAARTVIAEASYGPQFRHRTGHGIGLEAHEAPYLRDDNTARLQPGNTFTVEPGIYLEGRGGVRVEDDLAVAADGAETLSTLPRELRRLE